MNSGLPPVPGSATGAKACFALTAVMLLGLPATAQQASDKYRSPLIFSSTPPPQRAAPTCTEPRIEVVPIRGGLTRIAIETPCRPQQLVIFTYAGAIFIKQLDDAGRTAFTLDCFAGDRETVTIRFEDQTTVVRQPIVEEDMRDFSKVTIVWSGAVDLDLHAFEYSATFGGPGHVWSEQPRSLGEVTAERDGRGHGFLSTASAGGEIGMKMEVYTFVHQRGEAAGFVKLAVDYKSRGRRPRAGSATVATSLSCASRPTSWNATARSARSTSHSRPSLAVSRSALVRKLTRDSSPNSSSVDRPASNW